jgi:uncharacterized UPF0160 family protein
MTTRKKVSVNASHFLESLDGVVRPSTPVAEVDQEFTHVVDRLMKFVEKDKMWLVYPNREKNGLVEKELGEITVEDLVVWANYIYPIGADWAEVAQKYVTENKRSTFVFSIITLRNTSFKFPANF